MLGLHLLCRLVPTAASRQPEPGGCFHVFSRQTGVNTSFGGPEGALMCTAAIPASEGLPAVFPQGPGHQVPGKLCFSSYKRAGRNPLGKKKKLITVIAESWFQILKTLRKQQKAGVEQGDSNLWHLPHRAVQERRCLCHIHTGRKEAASPPVKDEGSPLFGIIF